VWQPPSDDERASATQLMRAARAAWEVRLPRGSELPSWESFPLPDRRLLARLLVQTARRQVQRRPTAWRGGAGR